MEIIKKLIAAVLLFVVSIATYSQNDNTKTIIQAFQKSYVHESSEQFNLAVDDLKKVYQADSYEINLRLGWLSYSAGQLNESLQYYQKATALKPYAIEPKFGLTYPASALGKWNLVVEQYKAVLRIAPNNNIALHKLGQIYYYKKNYIAAEKLFEKVVNLYPFDYDALTMLGWTKSQLKKYREANILFNKALMNNPSGASANEGMQFLENQTLK